MRDFPVEVVACFVGLVLIALFSSILFRKLRFPCTIGLVFVGMLLFRLGGVFEPLRHLARRTPGPPCRRTIPATRPRQGRRL